MALFVVGLFLLFVGYYFYVGYVERVLAPDKRTTPAISKRDGVDFLVLPTWKNMLIQLLNIAGVGPVVGAILGVKFGPIVFVLIPIGNILGGAVHDFVSGMMSLRAGGASLPLLIRDQLGKYVYRFFLVAMTLILFLVVAVFINTPAALLAGIPKLDAMGLDFWMFVILIFSYYILATLLPVDKIIGRLYPFFGILLLIGTALLFFKLLLLHSEDPAHFMVSTAAFRAGLTTQPVIPCLFVTIACGILSGFHATQSPIVARTVKSEFDARPVFAGMMVVEGVIAMIWAAAGMAFYTAFPNQMSLGGNAALEKITTHFLGNGLGSVTILAVVILAITTGDTALRSLRLSLAESFKIKQKSLASRLALTVPLIVVVMGILLWSNSSQDSFQVLWQYFAWGNQCLAAFTLTAAVVWLYVRKKNYIIALLPAAFILFIILSFILWTGPERGGPIGCRLDLRISYRIAAATALVILTCAVFWAKRLRARGIPQDALPQSELQQDEQPQSELRQSEQQDK